MTDASRIALILLAAGRSNRFGDEDKLRADLDGLPLALHAARMLGGIEFLTRIAVVGEAAPAMFGFETITNPDPALGMSHSLSLGMAAARAHQPEAVLVALADMPRISEAHIHRVIAAGSGRHTIIASGDGGAAMPPALFGAAHFDALEAQHGDRGARALLRSARIVEAASGELSDIDTPDDLARITGA